MLTDAEALWQAAEKAETDGAWTRHSLFVHTTGARCALGWLISVNGFTNPYDCLTGHLALPGVRSLTNFLGGEGPATIMEWNDHATQQEVVDTMRRVSKELQDGL